ncbi:MAG: hypothetical protein DHS20C13_29120 [Thermodesulfobacteriota bacterium]|nr:MAG: hypothetical protein DHS20C13_29120 [Thermodesulfobacteriota bacterium]
MKERAYLKSLIDSYVIRWNTPSTKNNEKIRNGGIDSAIHALTAVDNIFTHAFKEKIDIKNIDSGTLISVNGKIKRVFGVKNISEDIKVDESAFPTSIYDELRDGAPPYGLGSPFSPMQDAIQEPFRFEFMQYKRGNKAYPNDDEFWKTLEDFYRGNRRKKAQNTSDELDKIGISYRKWQNSKLSLNYLSKIIPDNTTILDYIKFSDPKKQQTEDYGVFVLKKNSKEELEVKFYYLGSATLIDSNIAAYQKGIISFQKSLKNKKADQELITTIEESNKYLNIYGKLLYDQLLAPLENELVLGQKILIHPDKELYLLPFEALRRDNNIYAIDSYELAYIDIKSLINNNLLDKWISKSNRRVTDGLIIVSPNYDYGVSNVNSLAHYEASERSTTGKWPPYYANLDNTLHEGLKIKEIAGDGAKLFIGDNAREYQILKSENPKFIHIASHGFFLNTPMTTWKEWNSIPKRNNPIDTMLLRLNPYLQSGIALTGFNRLATNSYFDFLEDDGILTASEIRRLDLGKTELVVLSACETGLGVINNGGMILGFKSAFFSAGAQNVVMSLWKVSDKWTRKLMESFYSHYLKEASPFEALSLARKEVRNKMKNDALLDHPYYWAAFLLTRG